jgi:predicted Holliday junction resolvase-like endonuclease
MVDLWERPATQPQVKKLIEELKTEMAAREDATQRAISVIRGEVTNLYSLWKAHRCWINNE